jgi:hypothetical protein
MRTTWLSERTYSSSIPFRASLKDGNQRILLKIKSFLDSPEGEEHAFHAGAINSSSGRTLKKRGQPRQREENYSGRRASNPANSRPEPDSRQRP